MPDFDAIAVALAGRFSSANVTPPVGFQNIRVATADLPGQMTVLPAVLIFADNGDFQTGNGQRQGGHQFTARFYLTEAGLGDLPRDMPVLRKWLTVLVDQYKLAAQLGGIVSSCRLMTWKIGIMDYAGVTYSGIEMGVHVVTNEGWAAVS